MRIVAPTLTALATAWLAACGGGDEAEERSPATSVTVASSAAAGSPAGAASTAGSVSPEGATASPAPAALPQVQSYDVPAGSHPHDVAPAKDGGVWYTAQRTGKLGWLDPKTGGYCEASLGTGSAPHGVIVGPDGSPWITDGGQNAIVKVDPATRAVAIYRLPSNAPNANLNTAAFDPKGVLWWTGQSGYYGKMDPATGHVEAWAAPRGRGPYGITATPDGRVFYASLAGSHIAEIDTTTGEATVIEPPTSGQGARRVWSDSRGNIWVSEWNAGQVARYEPTTGAWKEWKLPGSRPQAYAVYVDDRDIVWLSDFGANKLVRFDLETEQFESFELSGANSAVRQILGRTGEVWGAESGLDKIIVVRTE